jgi:D-glycero-alpha-D-manno-heptose 1-phosphate guanylyltransferase
LKAIVLCGGFGTRLGALTQEFPKPILKVGEQPFINYVLDNLLRAPIEEIILAVGFEWRKIYSLIGNQWQGIPVTYSVEESPLGTGGAIKSAMENRGLKEALVVNGDTLLKIDPEILWNFSRTKICDVVIALKRIDDVERFGAVSIDSDSRIMKFAEKIDVLASVFRTGHSSF